MAIDQNFMLHEGYTLDSGVQAYVINQGLDCGGFGITYLASDFVKVGNVTVRAPFAIKELFVSSDCERESGTNRVVYSNPAKERVENSRKESILIPL